MKVDFFLIGFQKCATTWVYKCLSEHPEIEMSTSDEVHYFDINFHKGESFQNQFYQNKGLKITGESTSTYVRSEFALERIHQHNPNAKFIVCMRDPVERAISHYWHERKKNKIGYSFDDSINYSGSGIYDLYNDYIETGMYDLHLRKFLQLFNLNSFFFVFDFQIKENPTEVVSKLFRFLEVDDTYKSNNTLKLINKSNDKSLSIDYEKIRLRGLNKLFLSKYDSIFIKKELSVNKNSMFSKEILDELSIIYQSHIINLEKMLNIDLKKHWITNV